MQERKSTDSNTDVVLMAKKLRLLAHLAFARTEREHIETGESKAYAVTNRVNPVRSPLGILDNQITYWIQSDIINSIDINAARKRITYWHEVMKQCYDTHDYLTADTIVNVLTTEPVSSLISEELKKQISQKREAIKTHELSETDPPETMPRTARMFQAGSFYDDQKKENRRRQRELKTADQKEKETLETAIEGTEKKIAVQKITVDRYLSLHAQQSVQYQEVRSSLAAEMKLGDKHDDLTEESKAITPLVAPPLDGIDKLFLATDKPIGTVDAAKEEALKKELLDKAKALQPGVRVKIYYWPKQGSNLEHISMEVETLAKDAEGRSLQKKYISWGSKPHTDLRRDLVARCVDGSEPSVITREISNLEYKEFLEQYQKSGLDIDGGKNDYKVHTKNSAHCVADILSRTNLIASQPKERTLTPLSLYQAAQKSTGWKSSTESTPSNEWKDHFVEIYLTKRSATPRDNAVRYLLSTLGSAELANRYIAHLAKQIIKEASIEDKDPASHQERIKKRLEIIHHIKNQHPAAELRLDKEDIEKLTPFFEKNSEKNTQYGDLLQQLVPYSKTLTEQHTKEPDEKSLQGSLIKQLDSKTDKEKAVPSLIEIAKCLSLEKQYSFIKEIVTLFPEGKAREYKSLFDEFRALLDEKTGEFPAYRKQQAITDGYLRKRALLRNQILYYRHQLSLARDDTYKGVIANKIEQANKQLKKLNKQYEKEFPNKKFAKIEDALEKVYAKLAEDHALIDITGKKRNDAIHLVNELCRSPDGGKAPSDTPLITVNSSDPSNPVSSAAIAEAIRDKLKIADCPFVSPKAGGKNDPGLYGGVYLLFYQGSDGRIHPRHTLIKQATDDGNPNHFENMSEALAADNMIHNMGMEKDQVAGVILTSPNKTVAEGITDPDSVYVASIYHHGYQSAHTKALAESGGKQAKRPAGLFAGQLIHFTQVGRDFHKGMEIILSDEEKGSEFRRDLGRAFAANLKVGNYQFHSENIGIAGERIRLIDLGGANRDGLPRAIHPYRATDRKYFSLYLEAYPKSARNSKEFAKGILDVASEPITLLKETIDRDIDHLVKAYGAKAVVQHLSSNLIEVDEKKAQTPTELKRYIQATKDTLFDKYQARKFSLKKMALKTLVGANAKNTDARTRQKDFEKLVEENPIYFALKRQDDTRAQQILETIATNDQELKLTEQLQPLLVNLCRRIGQGNPNNIKALAEQMRECLDALLQEQGTAPDPELNALSGFIQNAIKTYDFQSQDDQDILIQACDHACNGIQRVFTSLPEIQQQTYLKALDPQRGELLNAAKLVGILQNSPKDEKIATPLKDSKNSFTIIEAKDILQYIQGKVAKEHTLDNDKLNRIAVHLMSAKSSIKSAIEELSTIPGLENIQDHFANTYAYIGPKSGGAQKPGKRGARYVNVTTGDIYLFKKDTSKDFKKENSAKDISEYLGAYLTNVMYPGQEIAPTIIIGKHVAEDNPYIASEFFKQYDNLYQDIIKNYYQLPVVKQLLTNIPEPFTRTAAEKWTKNAEAAAKLAIGNDDLYHRDASSPKFIELLRELESALTREAAEKLLLDYAAKYKKEVPEKRPKGLGTRQIMSTKFWGQDIRVFRRAIERGQHQDLHECLVASLMFADFDAHTENIGVVTQNNGVKRDKRIDYGACLAYKHMKELRPDTRHTHTFGFEPTNHIREYPTSVRVSLPFAAAIETGARNLEDHLQSVNFTSTLAALTSWTPEALHQFAKHIGLSLTQSQQALIKPDELIHSHIEPYLKTLMVQRCQAMRKLAIEIRISLYLEATTFGARVKPGCEKDLENLIKAKENRAYFAAGEFRFRGKGQNARFHPMNNYLLTSLLTSKSRKILNQVKAEEEAAALERKSVSVTPIVDDLKEEPSASEDKKPLDPNLPNSEKKQSIDAADGRRDSKDATVRGLTPSDSEEKKPHIEPVLPASEEKKPVKPAPPAGTRPSTPLPKAPEKKSLFGSLFANFFGERKPAGPATPVRIAPLPGRRIPSPPSTPPAGSSPPAGGRRLSVVSVRPRIDTEPPIVIPSALPPSVLSPPVLSPPVPSLASSPLPHIVPSAAPSSSFPHRAVVHATKPQTTVMSMGSRMREELRIESTLNETKTITTTPLPKETETLRSLLESKSIKAPDRITIMNEKMDNLHEMKFGATTASFADKKTSDNFIIYAVDLPDPNDKKAMLAYAHAQIAKFFAKEGISSPIYILRSDPKSLAEAYLNICQANGLKPPQVVNKTPHAATMEEVPKEYQDLKRSLVEKNYKSEITEFQTLCNQEQAKLTDSAIQAASRSGNPRLAEQRWQDDIRKITELYAKLPSAAKQLVRIEKEAIVSSMEAAIEKLTVGTTTPVSRPSPPFFPRPPTGSRTR